MNLSTVISLAGFGVSVVGWIFTLGKQSEKFRGQVNGLGRRVTLVENSWSAIQGRIDEHSAQSSAERLATAEREAALRERIAVLETTIKNETRDR